MPVKNLKFCSNVLKFIFQLLGCNQQFNLNYYVDQLVVKIPTFLALSSISIPVKRPTSVSILFSSSNSRNFELPESLKTSLS